MFSLEMGAAAALTPVLIKLGELARRLRENEHHSAFFSTETGAMNFADAYLQVIGCKHRSGI